MEGLQTNAAYMIVLPIAYTENRAACIAVEQIESRRPVAKSGLATAAQEGNTWTSISASGVQPA